MKGKRVIDFDDYIDRYLMRIKKLGGKKPDSGECLTWYLEDDRKAARDDRIAERDSLPQVDDMGVPMSWRKR